MNLSRIRAGTSSAFDQLYNIVQNKQAFVGFRETAIDFPPTFKYDVLRTIRQTQTLQEHKQLRAPSRYTYENHSRGGDQPEPEGHHDGGHMK
jgi:hypothetical protein